MKSGYKKYQPYKVYPTMRVGRLRHPKPAKQPGAQYEAAAVPEPSSPENPDAGSPFEAAAASDASFRAMIDKAQGN